MSEPLSWWHPLPVWAIRHLPTGEWMPCRMYRTRGGWSYWTPGPKEYPPYDANPRLFFSKRAAFNARTAWLMGEHKRETGTSYDWEGIPDGYDNHIVNAPAVPRLLAEIEIVELRLSVPD